MGKLMRCATWLLSMGLGLYGGQAIALPGQSTGEVTAWIQAHPTLRPAPGETLTVRKSDTPARRFTFQASVWFPPSEGATNRGIIRSEQISLFDVVDGVNPDRLAETLRSIYGLEVYQDYRQSTLVYAYPQPDSSPTFNPVRRPETLLNALEGEIRAGSRYAYWLEIVQPQQGLAQNGQLTVFLREDVDRVVAAVQERQQ